MFSRVCVWATFRLGLELDQCKVYPITTKVFAGPNWYVLTSELLKLVHWKRSYVFTCPCHVEIHVAMFGPLAMSPTHLRMSQNRVYNSKTMCLGDWYRGACLGLYLDRFNHSVLVSRSSLTDYIWNMYCVQAILSQLIPYFLSLVWGYPKSWGSRAVLPALLKDERGSKNILCVYRL